MMVGISGVPGTGKSSAAAVLEQRGYPVVRIADTVGPFMIGTDKERATRIVDEEAWVASFQHVEGYIEGHLAHLLPCDRIVVLRCRPDVLDQRLALRGYAPAKRRENVESEALDLILIETLELHPREHVLEIDTTTRTPESCADLIEAFAQGRVPPSVGTIDWTAYLGVP
jgi:adenylate kinase